MGREVSVVITVLDMHVPWLRKAVTSCLVQSGVDHEVIIVDDGSGDGELFDYYDELERTPRVRVFRDDHRGVGPALNTGLQLARAPYVAHLGGDDVMAGNRLRHQKVFLDDNPDIDVLGGDMVHVGPDGSRIERTNYSARFWADREDPTAIAHPTVMARRKALLSARGYDEIDRPGADYRLWKRMMGKYGFMVLERVYTFRRVWPGSHSFDRSDLLDRLYERWEEAA